MPKNPRDSSVVNNMKQDDIISSSADDLVNRINANMDKKLQEFKEGIREDIKAAFSLQFDEFKRETDGKISNLKQDTADKLETLQEANSDLQRENKELKRTLQMHQTFLESLDHQNRRKVLIVTGVKEDEPLKIGFREHDTDEAKCKALFGKIGQTAGITQIRRLGELGDHPRPIRVEVSNSLERDAIVSNARKLKNHDNPYDSLNSIFIKKDQHPLVRQEWKRLYEVRKMEAAREENEGRTVMVDRKNRTVTIDGEIIDSFQNFQ